MSHPVNLLRLEPFQAIDSGLDILDGSRARLLALIDHLEASMVPALEHENAARVVIDDFGQSKSDVAANMAIMMSEYREWIRDQLYHLSPEDAEEITEELFALVQGAFALSSTTGDVNLFSRIVERVRLRVKAI
jgi:hypothetical protein